MKDSLIQRPNAAETTNPATNFQFLRLSLRSRKAIDSIEAAATGKSIKKLRDVPKINGYDAVKIAANAEVRELHTAEAQ